MPHVMIALPNIEAVVEPATGGSAAPVTCVVFDLGGVLIDWNPRYLYRKLFASEAAVEQFLDQVCSGAWNDAQDRGRPWDEAVALLSEEKPEFAAQIAAYRDRWEETLGDALHETVQLLAALRESGQVRLLALTNWSRETFPVARARFPFLAWFEGIVVSGEEGLAKPDPEIFELMRARYGLVPAQTMFIDDSARNVEAAARLGYRAVRFTDAGQLQQALRQAGLRWSA